MKTDDGFRQSRDLAESLDHWLELFDRELADRQVHISHRPLRTLMLLFREGAIEVLAGEERIDNLDKITESFDKAWFRAVFDAVEYWYVERYGAPALEATGATSLVGAQMIHGAAFEISIPANRVALEEEGELAWVYFEDGLGANEDATSWVVDGPDLAKLNGESRADISGDLTRTAEILRKAEFRRATYRSDGDQEVYNLIQSTLTYLFQAARRMVTGRRSEMGPAWFDLQIATEAALKAVILSHGGKQPHIHKLEDLLNRAKQHGVLFEQSQLSTWPTFFDISNWRYGQGVIPPFLWGLDRRTYAAILNFWAGVIPPLPMLGRSLL